VGTAPWQYILPNKKKTKSVDAFDAFALQTQMMATDIVLFQQRFWRSRANLLCGDARTLDGVLSDSVDLVITSPPYANNYDYADATRLEMTFWGIIRGWSDLQDSVRKHLIRSSSQHASQERLVLDELLNDPGLLPILDELGPICYELSEERHLHGGKKMYHTMVAAYFSDMAKVWQSLRRVCKPEAELCFVVGDSAPYGIHVPVDRWFAKLAFEVGFDNIHFVKTRDRNVKWKNRTHTVLLHEGQLWINANGQMKATLMDESEEYETRESTVTSLGHKLGQVVGEFFESYFAESLGELAKAHGLYCDAKGYRPKVRGRRKKVTWLDSDGNPHDLDYVFEYNGSAEVQGQPAAFIELAWRRYTKHSRNKAGEIEGALVHLGNTFRGAFTGAILGGEWTATSITQLHSHRIPVLHIPFDIIADTFATKKVDLRYAENANSEVKLAILRAWDNLSQQDKRELEEEFGRRIHKQYEHFKSNLIVALTRRAVQVRLFLLYGEELNFTSVSEAIEALNSAEELPKSQYPLLRFEIHIRFDNGTHMDGNFATKSESLDFLRFASANYGIAAATNSADSTSSQTMP
jgi:hypothetical protein